MSFIKEHTECHADALANIFIESKKSQHQLNELYPQIKKIMETNVDINKLKNDGFCVRLFVNKYFNDFIRNGYKTYILYSSCNITKFIDFGEEGYNDTTSNILKYELLNFDSKNNYDKALSKEYNPLDTSCEICFKKTHEYFLE